MPASREGDTMLEPRVHLAKSETAHAEKNEHRNAKEDRNRKETREERNTVADGWRVWISQDDSVAFLL